MVRRIAAAMCTAGLVLGTPALAHASDYDGRDCHGGYSYDDDCGDGGNSYRHDYSNHDRNRNRDRDRGAFSPGPFRDSPVTVWFCPQPNSCNQGDDRGDGSKSPPRRQQPGQG